MPSEDILASEVTYIETEPSGMTGHQQIFAVWSLRAQNEKLDFATSDSLVRHSLYWIKGRSEKLKESVKYFEAYNNYGEVEPAVLEMLSDPDVRYAYQELCVHDGRIEYESIWICSPRSKKLVYLFGY
jgi:hypothetical protein